MQFGGRSRRSIPAQPPSPTTPVRALFCPSLVSFYLSVHRHAGESQPFMHDDAVYYTCFPEPCLAIDSLPALQLSSKPSVTCRRPALRRERKACMLDSAATSARDSRAAVVDWRVDASIRRVAILG